MDDPDPGPIIEAGSRMSIVDVTVTVGLLESRLRLLIRSPT